MTDRRQQVLDRLDAAAPRAAVPAAAPTLRLDDWYNAITGIGVSLKDKRIGTAFAVESLTWMEACDLWRGDDLAARVVETIPDEMLRQGFEIRIAEPRKTPSKRLPGEPADPESDDETFGEAAARGDGTGWLRRNAIRRDAEDQHRKLAEQITSKLEDLGFAKAVFDALCYERAYGGAAILLGAKDGRTDLKQPLNPDTVRALDWLTVLEPRECQPIAWYNDPRAPKFGEPAIYEISPDSPGGVVKASTMQVHESRLIIFGGVRVTKRPVPGALPGWGDSTLTRVVRVLRDYNLSWSATAILLNDFSQSVIGMEGLNEILSSGNAAKLKERFQAVELSRSVAHAVLIDKEHEEYKRETTSVTGLGDLLDKMSARLAAACDMPLTLLMGQSPKGLGNEGDSDVRFFYDRVRAKQDRKLRPVIERLVKMLFKVFGATEPDSWSVHFHPLWQSPDKERAETMLLMAQVDEKMIASGVLSAEEVAKSRYGSDEYSLTTIIDWEAREAAEPIAPPPAKTESQLEAEQHERDLAVKTLEAKTAGGPLRKPLPTGK